MVELSMLMGAKPWELGTEPWENYMDLLCAYIMGAKPPTSVVAPNKDNDGLQIRVCTKILSN